MPISYSPSVRRGPDGLALGLAQFGMAVNSAIEQRQEEEKKRAQLTKTMRAYAAQAGVISKEEAEQLGLEDLQGKIQGHHFKQGAEELALRIRATRAQAIGAESANAANAALPQFARAYAEQAGVVGPQLPGGRIAGALQAAPEAAQSTQFDNLVQSLQRAEASGADTTPRVVNLAGPNGQQIPVVHSPGGHGFQVVPTPEAGNAGGDGPPTRQINGITQAWNGKTWVNLPQVRPVTNPALDASRRAQANADMVKTVRDIDSDIAAAERSLSKAVERKLSPAQVAAIKAGLVEKQKLKERVLAGEEQAPAPAAAAAAAPASAEEFTEQNPAEPKTVEDFEALPIGAYFRNPKDGRVLPKMR